MGSIYLLCETLFWGLVLEVRYTWGCCAPLTCSLIVCFAFSCLYKYRAKIAKTPFSFMVPGTLRVIQ